MRKNLLIGISILLIVCIGLVVGGYFLYKQFSSQVDIAKDIINNQTNTNDNNLSDAATFSSKPCELLTMDIAKQILGVSELTLGPNSGSMSCTYTFLNTETQGFSMISLLQNTTDPGLAKSYFDTAKTTTYLDKIEPVTGLKVDDAYYATEFKQLSILNGADWIILSVYSNNADSDKQLTIDAAKLIWK